MSKRGRPIGTRKPKELVGRDALNKRHSRGKKAMDAIFGENSDNLSDEEWNRDFQNYDKTKWDRPEFRAVDTKGNPLVVVGRREKNRHFQKYLNRKKKPR